ncbi:MAG: hypothetical protein ACD_65C00034G0002 [uncultured bacterium]|nr:MAG: hypothetical protein ACD_65C00034G0002 [uncultured bacterium]KKT02178.1 MAG: hypothetical protein UV80_C0005G0023 [Candidatus Peregrinibacteria bacterium GW2011_GWF2_43_17]KKT19648.1 MAG: SAM-dependent methyltransferase [Candidatus Peregrinibacteria bacterium GW2011_GWA2_43_8]HAU40060.1 hypothetical protein [Candidatus Peregrinibacteria bacterium]
MSGIIRPCTPKNDQARIDTTRYIESFIKKFSPKSVLDIGCGDGYLEEKYADVICGIDIDAAKIEKLKSQGLKNISVSSATDLKFDNDHFDMVIAKDLIEHLELNDVFKMFAEVFRVLKPGGRFVLTTWRDCQQFWDKIDHVRPYSNKWVANLCKRGMPGFEVEYQKELSAGIPLFGVLRLEWLAHILADKLKFRVDHGIVVIRKK